MDNKQIALIILVLFGGNLSGIVGSIGNSSSAQGHEDLQRQLDEIKLSDTECRASLSTHLEEYNTHIIWGRDVRSLNEGTSQKHEAQIQELYRLMGGVR